MDNFMDKIAQKLNSQELIRANAAADAAELESLEKQLSLFKEQMDKYDDCLQEMRKLNLKNIESAQGVKELADKAGAELDRAVGEMENTSLSRIKQTSDLSVESISKTSELSVESISKTSELSLESINKTSELSVASINQTLNESLAKIAEIRENSDSLEKMTENMTGLQERLEELFQSTEEFLHTDNVKVYRNVQAAMIEELEKQTQELKSAQTEMVQKNRSLQPFVIATMAIAIANLLITIARVLGLF